MKSMYCKNCGKKISSDSKFCMYCGTKQDPFIEEDEMSNYSSDEGMLPGIFTLEDGMQIRFSKGNLQYRASTGTWRFALNQWDCVGEDNANKSYDYEGWIDNFCWATSGHDRYHPYDEEGHNVELDDEYDWAYFNPIINGGNRVGLWKVLSHNDLYHIVFWRKNAERLRSIGNVAGRNGLILMPDDWDTTQNDRIVPDIAVWDANTYSEEEWTELEKLGVVFLPYSDNLNMDDQRCGYWTGSKENSLAYALQFSDNDILDTDMVELDCSLFVRPVRFIENSKKK